MSIAFSITGCCVMLCVIAYLCARYEQSKKSKSNDNKETEDKETEDSDLQFTNLDIGEKIGEGAYGSVFKGTWESKTVAIKQMRLDLISEATLSEFRKEIRVMTKLNSPFIIQFFGSVSKPPSIVMEFMSGGSLFQLLHNAKINIPWMLRQTMASEILQGLIYLHNQNIVHRDLKSPNILLDENNHPKLADFGLAKIKNETGTLTADSKAKGTLAWMAPELFEYDEETGQAKNKHSYESDMYSYGMVLWELAARKIPFDSAPNPMVVISWISKGKQEKIPNDTPKKVAKLINFCWNAEAKKRPTADHAFQILNGFEEEGTENTNDNTTLPKPPLSTGYKDNIEEMEEIKLNVMPQEQGNLEASLGLR